MTYSSNFKRKVGNTAGEEPVYLLEITHPQLTNPVRVVRDNVDLVRGHHLSLPGSAGNYASSPDSNQFDPLQNWVLYSEDLTSWGDGGAAVTSNAYRDPLGALTMDTLTDDSASLYESRTTSFAIPNDSSVWQIAFLVRKNNAATQRCGVNIGLSGGTAVNVNSRFALDGTNVAGCTVTSYDTYNWLVSATITNNSTGNTVLAVNLYPATAATKSGGDNVAGTGSATFGWIRVQRSAVLLPYVKTVGTANKGDIDLAVKVAMDDWTPAGANVLFSKLANVGQYCWDFFINSSGTLGLATSSNGTAYTTGTSTVAVSATNGSIKWVRVTRVANTGVIIFYTSDDGVTWTQLGTSTSNTAGEIFNGTDPLRIGIDSGSPMHGKVYRAEMRCPIGGQAIACFDPEDGGIGATSFASEETGETWTVNTSGSPAAAIAADETYIALAFDIQLPDDVEGKLSRIPLRIDNVGRELTQWLDASRGGIGAQARVMQVMRNEPDVLEFDITMDLLNVRQNGAFVTGELGYENTLGLAAMVASYRPDNTPGLF